jgi:hypothetical protein
MEQRRLPVSHLPSRSSRETRRPHDRTRDEATGKASQNHEAYGSRRLPMDWHAVVFLQLIEGKMSSDPVLKCYYDTSL